MPQPKSSTARKPAAKKPAAKKATAARKPAAKKSAAARKPAAKKATARKPAAARSAKSKAAARSSGRPDEALRQYLATLRDILNRGVVLTRERLQEAVDDAVKSGEMTRRAAEDLVQSIVSAGRKQTQDVVSDVEQLLGRGRPDLGEAGKKARERATTAGDKALQRVDKARRAAGIGSFPILNYDDLTAAQIADRVNDLSAAELRKIRDYERRTANRKSVLTSIEGKLS